MKIRTEITIELGNIIFSSN